MLIALTGMIGSGKSTVAHILETYGYTVIDADHIARSQTEPGSPVLAELIAAFGPHIAPDGTLDRQALADLAFHNPDHLATLNQITHPPIGAEIARQIAAANGHAIIDLPLLESREGYDLVIVVDVDPELAVTRLIGRGHSEDDARARIANQPSRQQRLALADLVIDNNGTLEHLRQQVASLNLNR